MKDQSHILLTGGTGFFGKAILRYLIKANSAARVRLTVTVLSRHPAKFLKEYPEFSNLSWLSFHQSDIMLPETLPGHLIGTRILHAAADSTIGPSLTPLDRYLQIVQGTQNMLDFAIKTEAKKFLYTSSGAVYGTQPSNMESIPENWHGMPDPLNPQNAYGIAKRAAEHLCTLYYHTYGLHTVIARCFAFVGPDLPLDVHFAIGNFIRDALYRDEIVVNGNGSPIRSYLDQADLAVYLLTLLDKGVANEAYNVGSDQPIAIFELANIVKNILSPSKKIKFNYAVADNIDRNIYIPNINKIKKLRIQNTNLVNSIQSFKI